MPKSVAFDEQAMEVGSAGDLGGRIAARLTVEERAEGQELAALRTLVDAPAERQIVDDLIRLNALEQRQSAKAHSIFAVVAAHGRALAGFFTEDAR